LKSGFVTLVGRPNVGKSTLLNRLVGRKLAITSEKPQTTRHRITGVLHLEGAQLVFLDTPGFQRPRDELGSYMQRVVHQALDGVDAVAFVVDATREPGAGDRRVAFSLARVEAPVFLVANKVDALEAAATPAEGPQGPARGPEASPSPRVADRSGQTADGPRSSRTADRSRQALDGPESSRTAGRGRQTMDGPPGSRTDCRRGQTADGPRGAVAPRDRLAAYAALGPFAGAFAVSAVRGDGVPELLSALVAAMPEGPAYFPADAVTDRPEEFLMAELVREQVFKHTRDEVPHAATVEVERAEPRPGGRVYVAATVYVERETQKAIVIGREGRMLGQIGSAARREIERVLGSPVYLDLRVRVKEGWRRRPGSLQTLGYRLD
jgi:GTP-binding protein Era